MVKASPVLRLVTLLESVSESVPMVSGVLGALPSMVMVPGPAPLSSSCPCVSWIVALPRLGSKTIVSEVPAAASVLAVTSAWRSDNSPATATA